MVPQAAFVQISLMEIHMMFGFGEFDHTQRLTRSPHDPSDRVMQAGPELIRCRRRDHGCELYLGLETHALEGERLRHPPMQLEPGIRGRGQLPNEFAGDRDPPQAARQQAS
jgi:hypothetical protein